MLAGPVAHGVEDITDDRSCSRRFSRPDRLGAYRQLLALAERLNEQLAELSAENRQLINEIAGLSVRSEQRRPVQAQRRILERKR